MGLVILNERIGKGSDDVDWIGREEFVATF